jgi:hypothetical protein
VSYLSEAGREWFHKLSCVLLGSNFSVPLVAFLVFGTQKVSEEATVVRAGLDKFLEQDILDAWGIRRAAPQGTSAATTDQQQATSPVSTASEDSVFSGPQEP